MVTITLKELQYLFSLLIEQLNSLGISELQLNDKWYWKVDENEKFVFEQIPTNLNVGSYSDDIERATKILEDKTFLFSDINTLSNLLKCIEAELLKNKNS
jgi:hypothetical protein